MSQYRILHPLESGPQTSVYLAEDLENSMQRVITVMASRGYSASDADQARIFEEAYCERTALTHPTLSTVFDITFRGRKVAIVSELLGPSLAAPSNPHPTLDEALQLASLLTDLVEHLHVRGMTLGYLTPSRIFRDEHGWKVNFLLPPLKPPVLNARTIRYVSPEFLQDGRVTPAGDLYSLGMLLYFLFTGMEPYAETDPGRLRDKQIAVQPTPPRKLNPDVPPHVERLILTLTEKKPEKRPTIQTVLDQILEINPHFQRPLALSRPFVGRTRVLEKVRRQCAEVRVNHRSLIVGIVGPEGVGKTFFAKRIQLLCQILGFRKINLTLPSISEESSLSPALPAGSSSKRSYHSMFHNKTFRMLRDCNCPSGHNVVYGGNLQLMSESDASFFIDLCKQNGNIILIEFPLSPTSAAVRSLIRRINTRSNYLEVELNNFDRQDLTSLLDRSLGTSFDKLVELVWTCCGGHPFYSAAFVQMLQKNGELHFDRATGDLDFFQKHVEDVDIPYDATEHLKKRLGSLSLQEVRLLRGLALFPSRVPLEILASLVRRAQNEVLETASTLATEGFVEISGRIQLTQLSLKGSWLAEVISQNTPIDELEELHTLAAKSLERRFLELHSFDLRCQLVWLSLKARNTQLLKRHLKETIQGLFQRQLYSKAAHILDELFESPALLRERRCYERSLVTSLYLCGQNERCLKRIQEFLVANHTTDDDRSFFLTIQGRILSGQGRNFRASSALKEALKLSVQIGSPSLHGEALGELLCSLSRKNREPEATALASMIFQKLRTGACTSREREKLYHALYFFLAQQGRYRVAIPFEIKAIQESIRYDNPLRLAGRMYNLGENALKLGYFDKSVRFTDFSLRIAQDLRNRELDLYGNITTCMMQRKRGNHSRCIKLLNTLLERNSHANKNPHIESELQIEIARNKNYLLAVQDALSHLQTALAIDHDEESSLVDGTMVKAWILLNLGRPGEALQVAEEVRDRLRRERGRYHLLAGQAYLQMNQLSEARTEAEAALKCFPETVPYYRTRTRLLQAAIALREPKLTSPGPYLRNALELAHAEYYPPLLTQAYFLKAAWLKQKRSFTEARAHCLRAFQFARSIERPLQEARLHQLLGEIELCLEREQMAREQFQRAIDILKERYRKIPQKYQPSFHAVHIASLENQLLRLEQNPDRLRRASPRFMLALQQLSESLQSIHEIPDVAREIVSIIAETLPGTAVNLFIRNENSDSFRLVSSRGICRRSGRQMLDNQKSRGVRIEAFPTPGSPGSALGMPIRSGPDADAFLYIERERQAILEVEVDFLTCLASIVKLKLNSSRVSRPRSKVSRPGLELSNRRKIITRDPIMHEIFEQIRQIAPTQATVLIHGESGTGKELFATALHEYSDRAKGPFIAINCSAIPADLAESELFGHLQGSFTGATASRKGVFEAASGGTLFLDEVSSMSLDLQARMLRVLQEKRVRRVGDTRERAVNVRVIAATNHNLKQMVAEGTFREDLYHRLNVFHIDLPPLRRRPGDIRLLALTFLDRLNRENEKSIGLSGGAMRILQKHHFPGNVRELENLVASLYYTCPFDTITARQAVSRLEGSTALKASKSKVDRIIEDLVSGRTNFWDGVRNPFLQRELSREEVREIIARGLLDCDGSYRRLTEHYRMPLSDYKRFLAFLSNHQCKVDFRPYRRMRG